MSLLERLVDRGVLVTVPALKSQKPRMVIAAALAGHGANVLLYLSAKPPELESGKRKTALTQSQSSVLRVGWVCTKISSS